MFHKARALVVVIRYRWVRPRPHSPLLTLHHIRLVSSVDSSSSSFHLSVVEPLLSAFLVSTRARRSCRCLGVVSFHILPTHTFSPPPHSLAHPFSVGAELAPLCFLSSLTPPPPPPATFPTTPLLPTHCPHLTAPTAPLLPPHLCVEMQCAWIRFLTTSIGK